MAEAVRVGLVGTSWWMDLAHLPMLKEDGRVNLAAICGRNRERAQEMATKYGIPRVFTDYRDMIAEGALDAIVIATPDDLHYSITMEALDAGLHVLCEKPLALNAADAKAMYEKAEANNVRHMTFYTWRWMPHYRYIRELIDQGAVGRIYHGQFSFLMGFGRKPEYRWRFDGARANGIIGDSGSHMFDLVHYLVGDVARINAHVASHVQREGMGGQEIKPASDTAMALLEFVDGGVGTVQVSALARVGDPSLEQLVALHGDAGSLVAELTLKGGPQLRMARGDEPLQAVSIPDRFMAGVDATQDFMTQLVPLSVHQPIGCRLFIDSIVENRPVIPSFYDGWRAQQLIDGAIASHESGQWVAIDPSARM